MIVKTGMNVEPLGKEGTMKPDDLPPKQGIEVMSRAIECECEKKEMPDKEKLIRFRCAQSLFNISKELEKIELMGSNVCLIVAKGLIADLTFPENAGSVHSQQTVHDSKVSEEVEAMAEKIREELNG